MKSVYTTGEISKATRLSTRLVQFYTAEKVVVPEVDNSSGRGKVKKYSLKNLMEFAILAELYCCGITLQNTKTLMKHFRNFENPVAQELQLIFNDPNVLKNYIFIVKIGNAGFRMSEDAEELLLIKFFKKKKTIEEKDLSSTVLNFQEVRGMPSVIILNINQIIEDVGLI